MKEQATESWLLYYTGEKYASVLHVIENLPTTLNWRSSTGSADTAIQPHSKMLQAPHYPSLENEREEVQGSCWGDTCICFLQISKTCILIRMIQ